MPVDSGAKSAELSIGPTFELAVLKHSKYTQAASQSHHVHIPRLSEDDLWLWFACGKMCDK